MTAPARKIQNLHASPNLGEIDDRLISGTTRDSGLNFPLASRGDSIIPVKMSFYIGSFTIRHY